MEQFNYEILSGIPTKEILAYFNQKATRIEEDRYYGDGWIVDILELQPVARHKIILPQTKIVFMGDRIKCLVIIEKYRKAFMRGGA